MAVEEFSPNARYTLLSATDPYALSDMIDVFGGRLDLVTGLGTRPEAGVERVQKLSSIQALNVS